MTNSFRVSTSLCALALVGALSAAPSFAAPTVAFSGPLIVAPGGSFQLDVTASGFTDLYAYQFDVSFDPALYSATGVSEGAFLASFGSTFFDAGQIDNATGTISFVLGSLIGPGAGASGAGVLAHLSFGAIGSQTGSGSFLFNNFLAYDSALNPIDVTLQGLTVATIPEPSTLALTLMGIGAVVFGVSRRTRRAGAK